MIKGRKKGDSEKKMLHIGLQSKSLTGTPDGLAIGSRRQVIWRAATRPGFFFCLPDSKKITPDLARKGRAPA